MKAMRVVLLFVMAVAVALGAVARSAPAPPASGQSDAKDKGAKKKDKKKDKKGGATDELNTEVFSDAVANDVLGMIRDGLEGHTQRLLLSAFDGDKMDGYLTFEDSIQALFERYEGFRVHFRIVQSTTQGARGVVMVQFEMEELPRGGTAPIRKASEVRFELERGRKGWRIVDFNPRGFFS